MVTYHTIFNYLQFRPDHLYSIFSVQNNNEIPRKIFQFQYKNWPKWWNAKSIHVPQVSNNASIWPRNKLEMTPKEAGPKTAQLCMKESASYVLDVYFDSSAMTVYFKLVLEWFRLYIYFSYILMVIAAVMVTIGIIITVITILQNLFCYGKVYKSESQFSQFLKVTRSVDQCSKHLKKILYIQRTKS